MSMSFDDLARKGNDYYLETLAPQLEPQHNGEYVVIEVESGDYYVDPDVLVAINAAQEAHPNTLFHIVQVGNVSRTAMNQVAESDWLLR